MLEIRYQGEPGLPPSDRSAEDGWYISRPFQNARYGPFIRVRDAEIEARRMRRQLGGHRFELVVHVTQAGQRFVT